MFFILKKKDLIISKLKKFTKYHQVYTKILNICKITIYITLKKIWIFKKLLHLTKIYIFYLKLNYKMCVFYINKNQLELELFYKKLLLHKYLRAYKMTLFSR